MPQKAVKNFAVLTKTECGCPQQKGAAAWVRQLLGPRYYALWDVGCVWKSTAMGLLVEHHVEIVHPLEVIGDILVVLIKNLNAGDVSLAIGLGIKSEHVAVCIREGTVPKIKAVGLEAGGDSAQSLAGAGTGLNGLVEVAGLKITGVEALFKHINGIAVRAKAEGVLGVPITINLGVANLLPLPALDGGRLFFLIIEAIRRKPINPKYEGYVHAAGLALLMLLMVFVTYNDIVRIIRS